MDVEHCQKGNVIIISMVLAIAGVWYCLPSPLPSRWRALQVRAVHNRVLLTSISVLKTDMYVLGTESERQSGGHFYEYYPAG